MPDWEVQSAMDIEEFNSDELRKITRFLGFGFYIVAKDEQFLECDKRGNNIFGLPEKRMR